MTTLPITFGFDNSYQRLPSPFFARLDPTPVAAPKLLLLNHALANELGLDPAALEPHGDQLFSGNRLPEDADPIALAYAGHQFGSFVPQLGDGRALLLGELTDRKGRKRDLQLKGSGRTPFSRQGDGRAWLGPVLREYLVSEAMHALGIPTTRALAAVTTGEPVFREHPLPGAILTRVAASHIRVGTFQYIAVRRDHDALRTLADYVVARHFPEIPPDAERPFALLQSVAAVQAQLIARWMQVGFIHGVMNTDNMTVSGETIDYGPCAFMDRYHPATVFSSIDEWGRYAYGQQPTIAAWNLARLAESLLPLMGPDTDHAIDKANHILAGFQDLFTRAWLDGMRLKIGLFTSHPEDLALIQELLATMEAGAADWTLTFRRLGAAAGEPRADATVGALFTQPDRYDTWAVHWRQRLEREPVEAGERKQRMDAVNPALIPRNHRVEAALEAAVQQGDLGPFQTLFDLLQRPHDDPPPDLAAYAEAPPPSRKPYMTFCGT